MPNIIVTEPATEPITTAEAKQHMRVTLENTANDTLIDTYKKAARVNIELITGVKLITQTWKMTLPEFPSADYINLKYSPIISIDEIKTIDADDTEAVFAATEYKTDLISIPAQIKLNADASWTVPSAGYRTVNGVEISYKAGYGAAAVVPEPFKLAIKLLTAHFYENRESTTMLTINELPMGVAAIIEPYRTWQRQI